MILCNKIFIIREDSRNIRSKVVPVLYTRVFTGEINLFCMPRKLLQTLDVNIMFSNEVIEMNKTVFDWFLNKVVSIDILIQHAHQIRWSAYIEAWINVVMYNLHYCHKLTIDHEFTRSCICVILTRNKYSSWYAYHVNGNWHNGILIWSCIVTLQYNPSYV